MNRTTNRLQGRIRPGGSLLRPTRGGMVLVVVMIIVVILSLTGLSFVVLMSTENKAVHLRGAEIQLESVVASGEEAIKAFVAETPGELPAARESLDDPDRFRGVLVLEDEQTARRGRFSVISPRIEGGRITGIRFGIENQSARLNLAVLPQWEQQQEGAAREALMSLPGMTDQIADAILDWIDADSSPRQFGAEADYYVGVDAPYAPRNAVPGCLEELLLVKGVTRELLFGADVNFNHQIDAGELRGSGSLRRSGSSRGGPPGDGLPWVSLLTIYSAEKNLNPEGKPRIFVNDKDLSKLHQQLSEVLDRDQADFIIAYRQFGPYEGDDEAEGPQPPVQPPVRIDFRAPGKHTLSTVLDLVGAKVRLPGEDKRPGVILESPLRDDPAVLGDFLPKLLDHVSVVRQRVIRGRVNVDLAPRAVLRGVPGLEAAVVERIIATRGSRGSAGDPDRRHATWLLSEGLVDLSEMKALLPYLTGGGNVFRAQVVGFFDRPGPTARVEVVIDATGTPPRRVYWKDLRLLGLGYPLEALGWSSAGRVKRTGFP